MFRYLIFSLGAMVAVTLQIQASNVPMDEAIERIERVNYAARKNPKDIRVAKEYGKLTKLIDDDELQPMLAACSAMAYRTAGNKEMFKKAEAWLEQNHPSSEALRMLDPDNMKQACPSCQGKQLSDKSCTHCKGTTECGWLNCQKGYMTYGPRKKKVVQKSCTHITYRVTQSVDYCSRCKGTGKCPKCNGTGKRPVDCSKCRNKGQIVTKTAIRDQFFAVIKAQEDVVDEVAGNRDVKEKTQSASLWESSGLRYGAFSICGIIALLFLRSLLALGRP